MSHQFCAGFPAMLIATTVVLFTSPVWADPDPNGPSKAAPESKRRGFRPVQKLLDLSGLAWMGGNTFLAVHDAKYEGEATRVRVSLLQAPTSLDGILWKPLRPRFPGGLSNDLESASRIPGTRKVLLIESCDDRSRYDRIYLARAGRNQVRVLDFTEWSSFADPYNVEGTAVAKTADGYLFLWAERKDGGETTLVQWRDLSLAPFAIGTEGIEGSISFSLPSELAELYNRPLVGMDVSASGEIYIVTAYDSGEDDGPYRSAVLKIGRVEESDVVLDAEPTVVGIVDGFKVESVALRSDGERDEVFIGSDDENYGGTLRPLPFSP